MFDQSILSDAVFYRTTKKKVKFDAAESIKGFGAFIFNDKAGAFKAYLDLRNPLRRTVIGDMDYAILVQESLNNGHDGFVITNISSNITTYGVFSDAQIERV